MATYGYVQVSTQLQVNDGLSIDAQQRQIKGYIMMNKKALNKAFLERTVSGSKLLDQWLQGNLLSEVLVFGHIIRAIAGPISSDGISMNNMTVRKIIDGSHTH